jgi:hypothetical protein
MAPGRDCDDPSAVGGAQCGPQALGELEVAEVIGGELLFVSAGVADQSGAHDAGVVIKM